MKPHHDPTAPQAASTRESILEAASGLIAQEGSKAFTLEAVAKRAGVSKGGLLYHFPSKESLLGALVQACCRSFDDAVDRRAGNGMSWLDAYRSAALSPGPLDQLGSGLVGALGENPALLAPARESYRRWYAQARREGGMAAVLMLLALDGLFLHQQMGIDAGISPAELETGLAALGKGAPS